MDKGIFLDFIAKLRKTTISKDIEKFILDSFDELAPEDKLEIIFASCNESSLLSPDQKKEEIEDIVKKANALELIQIKSFMIRSLILASIAFVGFLIFAVAYYINTNDQSNTATYFDGVWKMVKLILFDKT